MPAFTIRSAKERPDNMLKNEFHEWGFITCFRRDGSCTIDGEDGKTYAIKLDD